MTFDEFKKLTLEEKKKYMDERDPGYSKMTKEEEIKRWQDRFKRWEEDRVKMHEMHARLLKAFDDAAARAEAKKAAAKKEEEAIHEEIKRRREHNKKLIEEYEAIVANRDPNRVPLTVDEIKAKHSAAGGSYETTPRQSRRDDEAVRGCQTPV